MSGRCKNPIRRSEVLYLSVEKGIGSEQFGPRSCVCIQNDIGNLYSSTVIVAFITSIKDVNKRILPTQVRVKPGICGLKRDSAIMLEQIRTLDKRRIEDRRGCLPKYIMDEVDRALITSITNEEEKTYLENLSAKSREYVVNKLQFLDSCDYQLEVMVKVGADDYYISKNINARSEEYNALIYYCHNNGLNYDKIVESYNKLKESKIQTIIAV